MANYNRICVTISDSNNTKLNTYYSNTKKKINITKSSIVDLALNKFFEDLDKKNSVENEILKELVGE